MVKFIMPVYPCVMWEGDNIEEMRQYFPRYQFGQNGDGLTVFGPGFSGTVELEWFLYGQPCSTGLALSLTDPSMGPNFMPAPSQPE